jgi:hypothetical protein
MFFFFFDEAKRTNDPFRPRAKRLASVLALVLEGVVGAGETLGARVLLLADGGAVAEELDSLAALDGCGQTDIVRMAGCVDGAVGGAGIVSEDGIRCALGMLRAELSCENDRPGSQKGSA